MSTDKQSLIKITSAVYRVTELLPVNEPMRKFIRQRGLLVFAKGVILAHNNPVVLDSKKTAKIKQGIFENIAVLEACFDLVQNQGWAHQLNFVVLIKAYQDLKKEIGGAFQAEETITLGQDKQGVEKTEKSALKSQEKEATVREAPWQEKSMDLKNKRHRKILGLLQKLRKAQIRDLERHFPQTSKRTLRRDMGYLVENGFLKRVGDRNDTFYQFLT